MSQEVGPIDSFEAPDFGASCVIFRKADGSIESQCQKRGQGWIQTVGHNDEAEAKKFIRWWTTRPET